MPDLVQFHNIDIYANSSKICSGFNLTVKPGTIYPVIYNDQSLKYFFRYLLGLRGRVEGEIRSEVSEANWKKRTGFLPLRGGYYPEMAGKEQLQFFASIFPDYSADKASELVHVFELDLSQQLKSLPDYQRKLITMIGLLAGNANLLFLEEPFGQLPLEEQKKLQKIFAVEAEKGRSILFSLSKRDQAELGFAQYFLLTAEGILPREKEKESGSEEEQKVQIRKIPVWRNEKATLIDYDQIKWVTTNQGKSYINTAEGEFEVNILLGDLEKRLDSP
ncbi:MAG: hypothetical protein UMV23_06585, partial [Halanaerobium sp.]|nr:hypothetical protein [Halanaerobium sp.]